MYITEIKGKLNSENACYHSIKFSKEFLSPCLIYNNLKIKLYKMVMK